MLGSLIGVSKFPSELPSVASGSPMTRGQVGGCTSCGGYLVTGRDRDGVVVTCLNCSGGEGGRLVPQETEA